MGLLVVESAEVGVRHLHVGDVRLEIVSEVIQYFVVVAILVVVHSSLSLVQGQLPVPQTDEEMPIYRLQAVLDLLTPLARTEESLLALVPLLLSLKVWLHPLKKGVAALVKDAWIEQLI